MKAMLLGAGFGIRLRPLTRCMPKPLIPVLNKPLILWDLFLLKKYDIREVMINLHYQPEKIVKALENGADTGMKISYSYEENLLGTGGGIKRAEDFLCSNTFFVINSDILIEADLKEVLAFHRTKKALATMVLKEHPNPEEYSSIGIEEGGRIKELKTQTPAYAGAKLKTMVFTGIHVFEPKIFEYIPPGMKCCINNDIYPKFIEDNKPVYGYELKSYWKELGTLDRYFTAHIDILSRKVDIDFYKELLPQNFLGEGGISVGENTSIHSRVVLNPPLVLGKYCVVEEGAELGPFLVAGDRCTIGAGVKLKESILWDGSNVTETMENVILTPSFYIDLRNKHNNFWREG